jgi:hypothetical protein
MKLLIYINLVLLILFSNTTVYAESDKDFSFHGIELGMNEEQLEEDYSEFNCTSDQSNQDLRRCTALFEVANNPGVFNKLRGGKLETSLTFNKDELVNISIVFFSSLFDPATQLFAKYYGKPKLSKSIIKNRDGEELKNTTLIWIQGTKSIVYWKYNENEYKYENNTEYSRILYLLKSEKK